MLKLHLDAFWNKVPTESGVHERVHEEGIDEGEHLKKNDPTSAGDLFVKR